ncbi:uncharacterized protein BXZ73DRAFT_54223 [Epithele typhae]|uniref:uncharacterized protein n=1 Tax=Epithele typhae TaxID=378194 RepID=UPI002007947C|nr:uncharacterized protein BXZ73DRAFT_54223 [Epithele typhae]KAH9915552.1 hypothetical protein BXZ73DRAFT_54223 [Epithele typhae]
MTPKWLESFALTAAISLLVVNFTYKAFSLTWLLRSQEPELINNGIWEIDRPPVALAFDAGLHYDLNASAAWAALVPGDGLVHLGPAREPFLVSMLHQLRCLDVIRDQLAKPLAARTEQPARHCINYVRQMILCRSGLELDAYQYPSNIKPVEPHPERRCLDWRKVYEAVEENQREHAAWLGAREMRAEL